MNPSKFEIFLKVEETKNFTRTAEYYQYTQSAISQTIKSLENEMGVTLFHRTTTGLLLTDEGKYLLPAILKIARGHQDLEERLSELKNNHSGRIRLGGYISMSCHWLPVCVKEFKKLYPNVTFEMYQEDDAKLLDWLKKGTIDMAFICNPKKREFAYQELFKDPFLVILPPDYPVDPKKIYSLRDFKNESFIFLEVGYVEYLNQMFKEAGYKPVVKYRTIDDFTTLSMVEQGFGISILPKLSTYRSPFPVQTVYPEEACSRYPGIVTRKNDHYSWAQKKFMQFAKNFTI